MRSVRGAGFRSGRGIANPGDAGLVRVPRLTMRPRGRKDQAVSQAPAPACFFRGLGSEEWAMAAWDVNEPEFDRCSSSPATNVTATSSSASQVTGSFWGLRGEGGWVVAEDDEAVPHFPVWPHSRFADACAADLWAEERPAAIDIDEWVEAWLSNLERDGLRVAVFQTPEDQGVSVSASRLKRDLEDELARFSL